MSRFGHALLAEGYHVIGRRGLRIAAPLVFGSLLLAACGSSGGSTGSSSKPTFTIAYQGPLSGDNAALGINMANAVQLAIEQANKAGDLPFTLKYASSDDKGSPDSAPAAAQQLIDDKSVIAVVGPAFSGATKASEAAFTKASLVSVSPSATNPTLTSLGFKTFYRVVPPDDAQGKEAAAYIAKGVKAKNVYSIDDKSEYGTGLSGVLEPALKALGVTVKHDGLAPTKNYNSLAQKVAGAKPDAVYYSGYFNEFALFTKALRGAGYKGPLGGGDGDKDIKYVELAGSSAEGTFFTCPCLDATVDPNSKSFVDAYKAKFGVDVGTYSPEAYDAANAIISAIKGIGKGATRATVAAAVATIDYKGLTKQIKFTPAGEVEGSIIFVYQVKDGKIGVLGTTTELAK
ncbi:MAG: branched-chain amino acid transport system substrate-binding protein [Frankiales bacterium]|nr:branched-chain amino acid transport system substrate-binding protein [Frankiales bacterium]